MNQAMKLYFASLFCAFCSTFILYFLGGYDYTAGDMYCLVDLWSPASNIFLCLTLMIPCGVVTAGCYFKVYFGLRSLRSKPKVSSNRSVANEADKKVTKEEQLAVKMCILFIYWVICWAPAGCTILANSFLLDKDSDFTLNRRITLLSAGGCMTNAATNPFLCFLLLVGVRKAFMEKSGIAERRRRKTELKIQRDRSETDASLRRGTVEVNTML